MNFRQRTSVRFSSASTLVPAFCGIVVALGSPSISLAQSVKAAVVSSADTSNMVAATVNGEKITRGQAVADMLAVQTMKLGATNPIFQDKQREVAAYIGAIILKKMKATGSASANVSRAEIVAYVFNEKPALLSSTVMRMIQERVILQEAKKRSIAVTDAEVNAQLVKSVDTARQQYHLQGADAQILAQVGMSAAYLRPFVRTQLTLEKIVKADLEAKNGGSFTADDYVEASHILVSVKPTSTNPADTEKAFAEAKIKAEAIVADIKSGKSKFEDVAAMTNEDATKFKRGSLGTFRRGQMVPEFDKAVFALPPRAVSAPVKTQFGWHIIRVDRTGKELTGPEKKALQDKDLQNQLGPKIAELTKKAKITNTVPPQGQPGGMNMPG